MRLFMAAFLTLPFALALQMPASAAQVNLPAGTRVKVQVTQPISSGTATAGQRFAFQAAEPVVVGNRVVIAKGALGSGSVVSVSKAQGKSAGKLTLAFNSIHTVDGGTVALTQDSRMKGNAEKGKASTATVAATIALGPVGLFAHNMVKGKDVSISPSQTFPAWVKSNASVNVH